MSFFHFFARHPAGCGGGDFVWRMQNAVLPHCAGYRTSESDRRYTGVPLQQQPRRRFYAAKSIDGVTWEKVTQTTPLPKADAPHSLEVTLRAPDGTSRTIVRFRFRFTRPYSLVMFRGAVTLVTTSRCSLLMTVLTGRRPELPDLRRRIIWRGIEQRDYGTRRENLRICRQPLE